MKTTPVSIFNYSIQNSANGTALDIFIDGDIVDADTQDMYKRWFDDETSVSYKSFRSQVLASEAKTFNVYINSGGGLVTDAMAIHDLLIDMQDKGKVVNTIGRGIIASAATFILLAGKNASMSSNSWLMVHNVSGMTWGNVNEIESYAKTMRKFNDAAVTFYQKVTGLSEKEIGKMMDSETWMTATEAKEKGFIKDISGEATFSNSIKPEQWQFQNKAVLNFYNSFTKNTDDMKIDYQKIVDGVTSAFTPLLNKLGMGDKKDDEQIQNAMKEFGASISNAVKEAVPTEEDINKTVTDLVNATLKNIGQNEAFTNAIKEANKGLINKEDAEKLITESTKDLVTAQDLENNKTAIIKGLAGNAGGQSHEEEKDDKTPGTNNRKRTGRFANANWQAE